MSTEWVRGHILLLAADAPKGKNGMLERATADGLSTDVLWSDRWGVQTTPGLACFDTKQAVSSMQRHKRFLISLHVALTE